MTMRLAAAFARARAEQRPALITLVIPGFPPPTHTQPPSPPPRPDPPPPPIPLVTPGSPAPSETDAVFDAMVEGGADIVEVEIPFSDPLADGATIQRASFAALAAAP